MAAIVEHRSAYTSKRKPVGGVRHPIPIKAGVVPGPPYNLEAERHVLGLLMVRPDEVQLVTSVLCAADFFVEKHACVFEALGRIAIREEVPTASLVDEELKRMGKFGLVQQVYVHELLLGLTEFDDVVLQAKIVLDDALRRQEMAIGIALAQGELSGALALGQMELVQQRRLNQTLSAARPSAGILIEDVEKQDVNWLWHRRLARGKVTILDGDPGVGKGLMTLDIAARVSRGRPLPHDPRGNSQPANVLLFTPEDDVADTIRPRLEAAGADLHRIRFLASIQRVDGETGQVREQLLTIPRDVATFEETILHEGVELLIIDPITAVLDPGVKTNNDTEVRSALMPLATMAMRTNCAVLIVRHLNKGGGDNALYRGGGSIAFTGLARIGLMLAPHPDGDKKRVLAPVKNNVGRPGDALSFLLESDPPDAIPHLVWDEEVCEYDTKTLLTAKISDQRRDIIQVLKDVAPSDYSPSEIAQALGFAGDTSKENSLRNMLRKMFKAGAVVSRSYGMYGLPDRL